MQTEFDLWICHELNMSVQLRFCWPLISDLLLVLMPQNCYCIPVDLKILEFSYFKYLLRAVKELLFVEHHVMHYFIYNNL